jgi:plastocyanin
MTLQHETEPQATDPRPLPAMIRSMLRTVALTVVLVAIAAGCSSPTGSSSGWSFGPSLPPASGEASAAPSASTVPSAPPSAPPSASAPASVAPSPTAASASPAGNATPLTIGTRTGDELEFEPDEVSAAAGSRVSVTFENLASLPHNLTFGAPIDVATGPVVDPGASETIEFDAPAPGDYTFMCTIHPGMEGTLTVEPAG